MGTKPTFTNAAYRRSHLRVPKGRGTWAFQRTATDMAYYDDLYGSVVFAPDMLTLFEAKRWLAEQGYGSLWAVMP